MRFIILLIGLALAGCGNHPLGRTQDQRTQEIRSFFADTLDPLPGPDKPAIPFKEACLKHLEALYFIINSPESLEKSGIPAEITKIIPKDFEKLKGHSLETILKVLYSQEDSYFARNQEDIEKAVRDFKFELQQLKAIKIPKLGTAWTEFFQKILNNYFPDLSLEDKKRILAFAMRNLKADSTPTQSLLNWVYASGPFFQKYLQLMADYLEPGNDAQLMELKKGLMEVKSALPSIHKFHLDTYLAELREKGVDLELVRSLGAASVGEAFLARDKSNGKPIVVKFMRPGIEEIAKRERAFFKNQALLPALKESFDQIADQIAEELDYRTELTKIKQGITAYENSSQVEVVRPVETFPNSQRYFAMEFVDGKTFKQLGETKLEKLAKSILWEKVTRKFMQQALFAQENAFFHGDLHDGNLMVKFAPGLDLGQDPTRDQVQEAVNQGQIKVVLIDFGNAHALTQDKRQRLKNIFLSAAKIHNSPSDFLKALYPENTNLGDIEVLLTQTAFSKENRENSPPEKIGKAMDVLLENGLAIPGFLMAFKRTLGMLNNIYKNLEFKGSASLHHIAQDTYVNNLLVLIDEMSVETQKSLLDGIILEAQAAQWEGEQLVAFLNKAEIKDQWMNLRNAWAAETDVVQKKAKFYQMLLLVLPALLTKLPEQSKQPAGNTDNTSNTSQPAEPENPYVAYFKDKISSGFFVDWEAEQIAKLLDKPEAKQEWIRLRTEKSTKLIQLADFAAPIALMHGRPALDSILSGTFLDFESNKIADLLGNPDAKAKWIEQRKAWISETDLTKKTQRLMDLGTYALRSFLNKPPENEEQKPADSPSLFDPLKDYAKEKVLSGFFVDWEADLIATLLGEPEAAQEWARLRKTIAQAGQQLITTLNNPESHWYSKAYAGLQLLTRLPAAVESKILDIADKILPDTDYWYARYAIVPWKIGRFLWNGAKTTRG